jgi:hypothetical protein
MWIKKSEQQQEFQLDDLPDDVYRIWDSGELVTYGPMSLQEAAAKINLLGWAIPLDHSMGGDYWIGLFDAHDFGVRRGAISIGENPESPSCGVYKLRRAQIKRIISLLAEAGVPYVD